MKNKRNKKEKKKDLIRARSSVRARYLDSFFIHSYFLFFFSFFVHSFFFFNRIERISDQVYPRIMSRLTALTVVPIFYKSINPFNLFAIFLIISLFLRFFFFFFCNTSNVIRNSHEKIRSYPIVFFLMFNFTQ